MCDVAERTPAPPAWLVDVVEHRFGLAPYVTAAVWHRALSENLIVEAPEQRGPALVIRLPPAVSA